MDPFSNFHDYYLDVRSGDNDKIGPATEAIKNLETEPGFSETLLGYLASTDDEYYQIFIATQIYNQIKVYWENEQFYSNKEEFRNNLLQVMINSTGTLLLNISAIITVISQSDFPDKWPNLMSTLIGFLNEAELPAIYAILYTSSLILKRYEKQSSSDPMMRQVDNIVEYWGETLLVLLTDVLQNKEQCPELGECFNFCFQIIQSLTSTDLPKYISANIDKFLAIFHQFFGMDNCESIKITLCMIMKNYIIKFNYEINHWGKDEDDNKRTEEEIQNVAELWLALKYDLLNTLNSTIYSESDDESDAYYKEQLVIKAFDALTSLARSNEKEFFILEGNLEEFCLKTLIPCVSLSDEDIYKFENESITYFQRDISGLESETKRLAAHNFLKVLQRHFSEQLTSVFKEACQELLNTYNQNPDESWKDMDTAMFIMDIILGKVVHYNQGVITAVEGFDLSEFINGFIIPQLGSKFPLLQADALKFLVDYRMVIDPSTIFELFPEIAKLLFVTDSPVPLYTAYFIDRIMLCEKFYSEGPILFQNIDVAAVVKRLFEIFNVDGELNLIAARCLLRIVVYGKSSISEQIIGIVSTCVKFLSDLCETKLTDPTFNHFLFEIIVAAVTKVGVPVTEIEDDVIKLLDKIISNDISEFVPYVYQIIGCFLLHYPDDVLQANSESFYATSFTTFLEPPRWLAMGNIPALAILVQAYCIKLGSLVADNIGPIFEICEHLLQGTRSHPHAFMIFVSIIRFLPNEFVLSIMPKIYELVVAQLSNQELRKYRQSFAVFMSDACYFLGPDNAINLLGEDAESIISCWSESLPLIRGRHELESAISGSIRTLLESTVLPQNLWEQLFVGTVKTLECPSQNAINEDIAVIKIEEQDAKEFDTTFNKLVYAEVKEISPHPELDKRDLVEFMARSLAEYSQQHPGYLADVIERNLEPHLKNSFLNYQTRYEGVQFA